MKKWHNECMLSPAQKVARVIIRERKARKLSQRQVAAAAGFQQPYLAQVEKGVRPISGKAARGVEAALGLKPGRLCRVLQTKESRRFWAETRAVLRDFGRGIRQFVAGECRKPPVQQPHQCITLENPLWPMAVHLGEAAGEEVRRLELLRRGQPRFWQQFNSFRFDSWSEKRLLVRVALFGMQLVGVRLKQLGCSLEVVDGRTGGEPGLHRAFVHKGQHASLVWCPQVAVRTARTILCVDNLLLIRFKDKTVTAVLEVEGAPFHADLEKEIRRDKQLGVPVLHLDAARLGEPQIVERILGWARRVAERAC